MTEHSIAGEDVRVVDEPAVDGRPLKNAKRIIYPDHSYEAEVLGLVRLVPYFGAGRPVDAFDMEIDEGRERGVCFMGWDFKREKRVGSLSVFDVTDNPTEPNVDSIGDEQALADEDTALRRSIEGSIIGDGGRLIFWSGTSIRYIYNRADGALRCLFCSFVHDSCGLRERVSLMRFTARSRKVRVQCDFPDDRYEDLGKYIGASVSTLKVLPSLN